MDFLKSSDVEVAAYVLHESKVPMYYKDLIMEVLEKRQGLKVACLEGIAFRQGWITAEQLRENAQPMLKNDYGKYLLSILEEKNQTLKKNLEF